MERKDFLKNACSYGFCGCVGISILAGKPAFGNSNSPQNEEKSDWRVDFMQNRFKMQFHYTIIVRKPFKLKSRVGQLISK